MRRRKLFSKRQLRRLYGHVQLSIVDMADSFITFDSPTFDELDEIIGRSNTLIEISDEFIAAFYWLAEMER